MTPDYWKIALTTMMIIVASIAIYNTIYYPLCAMYMGLGALGAACYMIKLGRRDRNTTDPHDPLYTSN